jgi:pimeloyl-ACP methyl ester carboxylesterase
MLGMTVADDFRIGVPDAVLADLQSRLARSRFSPRSDERPWQAGTDPDYLGDLVAYWVDSYDWRKREAELNQLPQRSAEIDGRRLHFLHFRAAPADGAHRALPLILSHGWPSSFVEMLPLAARLADPGRYDADPADAFDVVVPSLPGFLYSELPDEPLTRAAMARILHALMTDVLGYRRYGAFGGDIGGAVSGWMGALHPDHVVGVHLIHPPLPDAFDPPPSPAEEAFLAAEEAYDETDRGYSEIMGTRPDTIAAALIDSPAGLAAWVVDKYRDWSDCHGDLESRFDRDTLLTILTLYWVTDSIGSSFRQYYDWNHNTPRPPITVPMAVTLSAEPVFSGYPRELAERCADIRHWSEPGRGGHFMPLEEPELLAAELRTFFRALRE